MKTVFTFLRHVWGAGVFSPTAFLVRAVFITALFCVSECLGWREYTTFLSGTSANPNINWHTGAVLGLIHLLLYVGFILLAPIFLITAGLLTGFKKWVDRGGKSKNPSAFGSPSLERELQERWNDDVSQH